jgi:hypothetical protein
MVANLTRYSLVRTDDRFDDMEMVESTSGEYVKFEEAVEASSNSLQQLKAEIAALVTKCNTAHYLGDDDGFDSCIEAMRQLSAI